MTLIVWFISLGCVVDFVTENEKRTKGSGKRKIIDVND